MPQQLEIVAFEDPERPRELMTPELVGERYMAAGLTETFLKSKSARTRAAYGQDLSDFASFLGVPDLTRATHRLVSAGLGEANGITLQYRSHMLERGLSPATVNRRLSALRALIQLARMLGLVRWTLEVPGVPAQALRDTRGPGLDGYRRLLQLLADRTEAKAIRDRAILRLLFDRALRRGEVASLDLEHVDLDAGTVTVLGKGRRQRETLSIPTETAAAVRAWVAVRGTAPGPLFLSLDRGGQASRRATLSEQGRLSDRSILRLVKALGDEAGIRVRPHGLRHAAITEALERTNGNVRSVQRFSRHRDVRTLQVYDDNREDLGGAIAQLLAGGS